MDSYEEYVVGLDSTDVTDFEVKERSLWVESRALPLGRRAMATRMSWMQIQTGLQARGGCLTFCVPNNRTRKVPTVDCRRQQRIGRRPLGATYSWT